MEFVFLVCCSILIFILSFLNALKTNKQTKDFSAIYQEVLEMYKSTAQVVEDNATVKQGFDKFKTQYKVDKVNNVLVELPDKIDIQKLVQSSVETALDRVLNRFTDNDPFIVTTERQITHIGDKLDQMLEYQKFTADYMAEKGLDVGNYTPDEITAYFKQELATLNQKVVDYKNKKPVITDEMKKQIIDEATKGAKEVIENA